MDRCRPFVFAPSTRAAVVSLPSRKVFREIAPSVSARAGPSVVAGVFSVVRLMGTEESAAGNEGLRGMWVVVVASVHLSAITQRCRFLEGSVRVKMLNTEN